MVGIAVVNNSNAPTVAAAAMESIGYLSALELAYKQTGILLPYAIFRAASDLTFQPIYEAKNGTWLQGPAVHIPIVKGGPESHAFGTVYAISMGT